MNRQQQVDSVDTTSDMVGMIYDSMQLNLKGIKQELKRPLTLSEKILFTHLQKNIALNLKRGESYLALTIDRVVMQDATAQMALLQFIESGRSRVAVPTSIHCDHLIQAHDGSAQDLSTAIQQNKEVYKFLKSASEKFGIGFWEPGSGIIHQVALENYAFPGGLVLGSDSHTPNLGGLGMLAIGVGGADAVDAMTGQPWEVLFPKLIGIRLTGKLNGWASPKDVILTVAQHLTVKGGTNRILEYFGPGARTMSATGKATITNMGAEIGATSSIFPYDEQMRIYLEATNRSNLAKLAEKYSKLLIADEEVEENPNSYFDEVLEINLSEIEPYIAGPFTPDLVRPVSTMSKEAEAGQYPTDISFALIGSCTNSSYEDITRAAAVAADARRKGLKAIIPLLINPGSAQVLETLRRDGQLTVLESIGATVLANACGPCIGQWKRDDFKKGEKNTIVNSYNRNFPGRNDGNNETHAFVMSPEVVVAYSLVGTLLENPLTKLTVPPKVAAVPQHGYVGHKIGYYRPSFNSQMHLYIPTGSDRIQLLEPFEPIVEPDLSNMPVLFKTKGKTTTDHISPAGKWLKYRGNLNKISDNLLLGALNAWTGKRGKTINIYTNKNNIEPSEVARYYKSRNKRWVIVADENYGEGSSREHAAMTPRFLGAAAVIAKSFARIHESNLKKQGILPLQFVNPSDYDLIQQGDTVTLEYLHELDPIRKINMLVQHQDGLCDIIILKHNINMEQLSWFHAGSALNLIRKQEGKAA